MNWDVIGATSEAIGTVLIVITIFYLAMQTRLAAKATTAQSFQDHFRAITDHFNEMWSSDNADLMIRGFQSYFSLSPADRGRFDNLVTNTFNLYESSLVYFDQGLLEESILNNWTWYMRNHLLCYPGVREWWPLKQGLYGKNVRDSIDELAGQLEDTNDIYGLLDQSRSSA